MNATVYSKPACSQCLSTYRALDKKDLPYSKVDVTQDADAYTFTQSLGYMQAPVVVIRKDGEVIDHWSGFNPEKIENYKAALAEVGSAV